MPIKYNNRPCSSKGRTCFGREQKSRPFVTIICILHFVPLFLKGLFFDLPHNNNGK